MRLGFLNKYNVMSYNFQYSWVQQYNILIKRLIKELVGGQKIKSDENHQLVTQD